MKIYISGQITGIPYRKAVKRFAEAREVLLSSVTSEHINMNVINPLTLTEEKSTREAYMKICIRELLNCECIYMLRGWQKSLGAVLEYDIAAQIGLEIWDEL